jgi:hypothetical protein
MFGLFAHIHVPHDAEGMKIARPQLPLVYENDCMMGFDNYNYLV